MKNIITTTRLALVALTLTAATTAAADTLTGTLTITLRDGTVHTYAPAQVDSLRYVGGQFGSDTGVGVKIYLAGSTASEDFLYSQITDLTIASATVAAPTISPAGGTISEATTVTITAAAGTIYYTTDGTNPLTSGTALSGASPQSLTVSSTTTVRAIAISGGVAGEEATATFTYTGSTTDSNANANWWSSNWTVNNGSMTYTPKTAGFWRLEVPHLSDKSSCSWVQKSESGYGIALALEWDNDLVANRWTCYQLHAGNSASTVGRKDSFKTDTELPSSTRSEESYYKSSGYSKGHLCPSADRRASYDQQALTYYMSNMHPQWQGHNGTQWANLETDVRSWYANTDCDTLYIVKAATIGDVTLNGSTESGVFSTTYGGKTYADLKCNGKLLVPKYFYMALLAYIKSPLDTGDGTYHGTFKAMGVWTVHYNGGTAGADNGTIHDWPVINKQNAEYITIDELERRTGIDFFCNLPDDIEAAVEATLDTSFWSAGAALNR